ncbi:MAG: hypothetical protein V4547_12840 [Bacteroidota bacterium]
MKAKKTSFLLFFVITNFLFLNGFSQNETISLKDLGISISIDAPKGTKVHKKENKSASDFSKKYTIEGTDFLLIVEEISMVGNTIPVVVKRNKSSDAFTSEIIEEFENGYITKTTGEGIYGFKYIGAIDARKGFIIYNDDTAGKNLTKEQAKKLFDLAKTSKIVK